METHATSKGQIVIPIELRRKYGIFKGTRIAIIDDGFQIILKPITEALIRSQFGRFRNGGLLDELKAFKREEREREEKRVNQRK